MVSPILLQPVYGGPAPHLIEPLQQLQHELCRLDWDDVPRSIVLLVIRLTNERTPTCPPLDIRRFLESLDYYGWKH
jgi:hypothetical protein